MSNPLQEFMEAQEARRQWRKRQYKEFGVGILGTAAIALFGFGGWWLANATDSIEKKQNHVTNVQKQVEQTLAQHNYANQLVQIRLDFTEMMQKNQLDFQARYDRDFTTFCGTLHGVTILGKPDLCIKNDRVLMKASNP